MSKKNIKPKKFSLYRHYKFNRLFAQALNDDHYQTWLIMDEGLEKPYPQRFHNFLVKYGMKNHKTGRSILSYIPEDNKKLMLEWIAMTSSEKKQIRKIAKERHSYNIGKKITGWLHQAEIMYLNDIENYGK